MAGIIPRVATRVSYWALSAFWLGVSVHWAAFLTIAMQARVNDLAPEAQRGAYLAWLAATGALIAVRRRQTQQLRQRAGAVRNPRVREHQDGVCRMSNAMKSWSEVIRDIIESNGGQASLHTLYQQAEKHRNLPTGDWQKTLRGVLYRQVRKGEYVRVGLGVFALPQQAQNQPATAYRQAAQGQSYLNYLEQQSDTHGAVQGMLIEIGNHLGYLTYTSDKNRIFDGKPLVSLCQLSEIPPFAYPELVDVARNRDVLWFSNTRHPFPKYIYDVEHTTNFRNSMQQMYQLKDLDARFVLVADKERRAEFQRELEREPFFNIAARYRFRSYEEVARFYFSCVEHYELRLQFLDA